jgi:hypothetical protein
MSNTPKKTDTPYNLQLLSLTCLRAQERDGDEICVYVNKQEVFNWQVAGRKMSNQLAGTRGQTCTNELDFTKAAMQIEDDLPRNTFIPMNKYTPADFRMRMEHIADIMILEKDDYLFNRKDDLVGHAFIIQLEDGDHRHVFRWENCMYRLQYRVIIEA